MSISRADNCTSNCVTSESRERVLNAHKVDAPYRVSSGRYLCLGVLAGVRGCAAVCLRRRSIEI